MTNATHRNRLGLAALAPLAPAGRIVSISLATVWIACGKHPSIDQQPLSDDARGAQATSTEVLSPPTVLATNQSMCDRIVADATNVFWTTRSSEERFPPSSASKMGRIWTCPVAGCGSGGPTLIVQGQSHLDAIAIDPTYVYWSILGFHGVRSAILKCPRAGCAGTPTTVYVYPTGAGPSALAVDSSGVFWTDTSDQTVKACPLDGCRGAPRVLARSKARPRDIAVVHGLVYWTNYDGSVMTCDARGCGDHPELVGRAEGSAADLVVDDVNVTWVNHRLGIRDGDAIGGAQILSCPVTGCAGPPSVLFTTDGAITALASIGQWLHWGQRGGAPGDGMMRCPRDRCVPRTVVGGEAGRLAVSAAGVFWVNERSHDIETLPR